MPVLTTQTPPRTTPVMLVPTPLLVPWPVQHAPPAVTVLVLGKCCTQWIQHGLTNKNIYTRHLKKISLLIFSKFTWQFSVCLYMYHYQVSKCSYADFLSVCANLLYVYMSIFSFPARPMRFLVQEGHTPWVIPRPVPSVTQERCVRTLTVQGSRPVSRGPTPWPGHRPVWTVPQGMPVPRLTPPSRSSVSQAPTHWPKPQSVHHAPQDCKYIVHHSKGDNTSAWFS